MLAYAPESPESRGREYFEVEAGESGRSRLLPGEIGGHRRPRRPVHKGLLIHLRFAYCTASCEPSGFVMT